jgi:imidazoleglycerol-phosphate dehydratase
MRTAEIKRKTAETDISLILNLDGIGRSEISTGVGFFDHMLTLLAKHARFDLNVTCLGDTQVDAHHSVEDVGIALGSAFFEALGDKRGICRYGNILLPMDETLIMTSLDISGARFCASTWTFPRKPSAFLTQSLPRNLCLPLRALPA